ncbi:bacitracin ABC transporter ATP-binding protein [Lysobacteraceae bacterium NML120232]|nr:bacitracin ABC transporter ATP-binding protein [Xanthomonadaceae bacterium NML120232]
MNDEFVIKTEGLTKIFPDGKGVKDINLKIRKGAIYGLLGPNGAGKTTVMKTLLGLLQPTRGIGKILGCNIGSNSPSLSKVGSLIEGPSLYGHLTGRENLEVIRRIIGAPRNRVSLVLELVSLEEHSDKRVLDYSLGMKQRIGLAIALLNDPEVLILDEPGNGLDPAGSIDLGGILKNLSREGKTILISSHLLHDIEQIATDVGIMCDGILRHQGKVSDDKNCNIVSFKIQCENQAKAIESLNGNGWNAVKICEKWIELKMVKESVPLFFSSIGVLGIEINKIKESNDSLERLYFEVTN